MTDQQLQLLDNPEIKRAIITRTETIELFKELDNTQQTELKPVHIFHDNYEGNGVRDTSKEAFNQIIDSLSNKRLKVFRAIQDLGGKATNRQIGLFLMQPINRITPRVNELVKLGALRYGGKTFDNVTKKSVIFWELNR